MRLNPHLIGSYKRSINNFVLFDRKIASSLITMFYDEPITIYKKENKYNLTKSGIEFDIEKTKITILVRNPISRTKSYIAERVFKQLHHFINSDSEYKDGYDTSIFKNKKTLELFNNTSKFVYLKDNKYYFNDNFVNSEFIDDFIQLIISSLLDFIKANNSPTLENNYNQKIYNLINTIGLEHIKIIDTSNLSNHFTDLGINPFDAKFTQSELHRNHLWSEMIKSLYSHIKSHSDWDIIYTFFKNEVYHYRNIIEINKKLKTPNPNKTLL